MAYISKEEVKIIREMLKKKFPDFKFSISGGNSSSLNVSILSSPYDFSEILKDRNNIRINEYHFDIYGKFSDLFSGIVDIMKSQDWFDESDSMTDYFHTAYYINLSIGNWDKQYTQVEK